MERSRKKQTLGIVVALALIAAATTFRLSSRCEHEDDLTVPLRAIDDPEERIATAPLVAPPDVLDPTTIARALVEPDTAPTDEFAPPSGEVLLVRVVDEFDAPVAGAVVEAKRASGRAITDGDGLARLVGLRPDETVVSVKPTDAGLRVDPFAAKAGVDEVRAVAYRIVHMTGRVVDSNGMPLEGILLWVTDKTATLEVLPEPTAADGSFCVEARPGARLTISISGKVRRRDDAGKAINESTPLRGALRQIRAPATDLLLVARDAERNASLVARVVDPEHKAASGIRVLLGHLESVFDTFGVTDSEGRVRFDGLEAGVYSLFAHGNRSANLLGSAAIVEAGGPEVTVVLRHGAPLAGAVVDPFGAPVPGAHVWCAAPSGVRQLRWTGPDGRFEFLLLPGSTYDLTATITMKERNWRGIVLGAAPSAAPSGTDVPIRLEESL